MPDSDDSRVWNRTGSRISVGVDAETEQWLARMDDSVEGPIASLGCAELKQRLLDHKEIAKELPQEGCVSMLLRETWRRNAVRLHFAARQRDCITPQDDNALGRHASGISTAIGEPEVFDVADSYDRALRAAFSGSVAGMGIG